MFLRESRVALNPDRRLPTRSATRSSPWSRIMQRKSRPWVELRKDQPGPAERACFGQDPHPFELGKLPPNFLKVGTKVTGALELTKDEGSLDHFGFLTCPNLRQFEFC